VLARNAAENPVVPRARRFACGRMTMSFQLTPERETKLADLLTRYPTKRAALLPLLHLCQEQNGWISDEVIAYAAERLGLSTAQVKGVVTFYTMYHQRPVAPNVVWVCRTLSCELRGAKLVQEHLEKRFGCRVGGTSKDGKFTLLKAECLAACGYGPMIQLNDTFHEDLTLERLDRILDEVAARTPAPAAHQDDRGVSHETTREAP
jgi:NADH-quinone oxidoreductase subunit E